MKRVPFLAAAAIAADIGLARFSYSAYLPDIARDLSLDKAMSGYFGTVHMVGYLLGSLACGRLMTGRNAGRFCRFGHVLFGIGMLAASFSSSQMSFAGGRLVAGFGAGWGVSSLFPSLMRNVGEMERKSAVSFAWSGIGFGIIGSGAALETIKADGAWRLWFLAVAIFTLAVAMLWPTDPVRTVAETNGSLSGAAARSKLIRPTVGYFGFGVAYLGFSTFAGMQLSALGYGADAVALFWVILGLAALLGGRFVHVLLKRLGSQEAALAFSLAVPAVGASLTMLPTFSAVLIGAALVGAGLSATPALITMIVRDKAGPDYEYPFAVITAIMALGQILGPSIAGVVALTAGLNRVPLFTAGVYVLSCVLVMTSPGRRA